MLTRKQLIKEYLEFFKKKGHKEIQNSPLIPKEDPTVLFTTAGMHPLVPFLLGEPHPLGKRLCNLQKCIRTGDIEEVGDETHHTFFEMLGNWSLGDYWKKEAIEFSFEFHTKILKIPLDRYAVTVFSGDKNIKKDEESIKIWLSLGIPKERIALLNDNWWGPVGEIGPCGPDTEMFYWSHNNISPPKEYNPNDSRWMEIGNNVLLEFIKEKSGKFTKAKQKTIDFGGGVERTLAAINGFADNYLTDAWNPIIKEIEKSSGKKYGEKKEETKAIRIIADHIKASVFILAEGITPSNTEQGYVLRRLIRRAIRYASYLDITEIKKNILEAVFKIYEEDYPELKKKKDEIFKEFKKEEEKFNKTLDRGMKEAKKMAQNTIISGKEAFLLYQSYGFPIELTKEIVSEFGSKVNEKEFEQELKKHQELSRTASVGRFKSGLADHSEKTTKLHTATHLLLAGLREILKDKNIIQKGSNITSERLRLDFSFPRKITEDELKKIEDLVNKQIKYQSEVIKEEMSPEEAKEKGALGTFGEKYGKIVSVYSIGNFSKEICSGPHVKNLKDLGKFKILKEESSSAGVRRIKADLE